jgi:fructokinase
MDSDATVVGIGELLWDCFGQERRPGGAPANVAFHAAQLGLQGLVVSRVGDDPLGRELVEHLRSRGLDTSRIQIDAEAPTGTVDVDVTDPSHPSYTIHEDVAWDRLAFSKELQATVRSAAAVCIGTLAQRAQPARDTIARCLEQAQNALVVFDVNLRQHYFDRALIQRTLERSHIVKLNLEEVGVLARLLEAPSSDPVDLCKQLVGQGGPRLVCVTRAAQGCLLVTADDEHVAPGVEVEVADAVGAGDAFTAALIASQLRRWPLAASAWFANQVGALVAGRAGAMPDLGEEMETLTRQAESGVSLEGGPP